MRTLLAAALAALPLAALAGDPAPARTTDKMAVPAELHNQGEATPGQPKTSEPKAADAKPEPGKPEAKAAGKPATETGTKTAAKTAAKGAKPEPKKGEKPCEPVKPCSID